ncbi:MAG: VCBS repeat-containing protein, partial [Aestuariibacter sp.]|nr:VCBS repeat-containing protein [Aestuariibacter sp.]
MALVDLDADGDLDAVVAAAPTASRVYLNQGGTQGGTEGIFLDSAQVLPAAISVAIGDLDADGDPDCFAARAAADQVWLNNGSGAFATSQTLPTATSSNDVALGDLDSDGDLDAFVVSAAFNDLVWINQGGAQGGTGGVFADSGQTLGPSASRGVALGDLDADGDLDAYVAAANGQPDHAWMNQGDAVFADSGQALGTDSSVDVALAYLDGDGRLDAFVATLGPERVWLGLLGGSGTGFFEELATYMAGYRIFGMAVADFDGDGSLDVAATALDLLDDDEFSRLWLNAGDGSGELAEAAALPFWFPLKAGDVDGDGDVDLVGREPFITRITLNDGSGTFQESAETMAFDADGIELADIDGDGDLAALLSQQAADPLPVWINPGGAH